MSSFIENKFTGESEGIYLSGATYNSIVGNRTTCDHPGCHKIAEKHYFKGDEHFWEMFKKSRYAEHSNASFFESRILILGFCAEHGLPPDNEEEAKL